MTTLTLLVGEEYYRNRFAEHEKELGNADAYIIDDELTWFQKDDVLRDMRWSLRMGHDTVISAPATTKSERAHILKWVPEGTITKCIIFGYLPDRYEAPSYEEGFRMIIHNK